MSVTVTERQRQRQRERETETETEREREGERKYEIKFYLSTYMMKIPQSTSTITTTDPPAISAMTT